MHTARLVPWIFFGILLLAPANALVAPTPAEPLPRVDGLNADFLDGLSSENILLSVDEETAARIAADEAEAEARAAADEAEAAVRADAVADETAAREAADAAETAAREAADAAETAAREAADAALSLGLAEESDARFAADSALASDVDAVESAIAAGVPGVAHNAANAALGKTVTTPYSSGGSTWPASGATPGNLANAVDGNLGTSTTEGLTFGGGTEGFVVVDLGSVQRGIAFAKVGVRVSSATGNTQLRMWSSTDGARWILLADTGNFAPGTAEKEEHLADAFAGRYVRIGVRDVGQGQVGLKIYDVSVKSYT